jgi:hypothetical protein
MHKSDYNKKDFFQGYPKATTFYELLPGCPLDPGEYKGVSNRPICLGIGQVCVEDYSKWPSDFMLPCTCVKET